MNHGKDGMKLGGMSPAKEVTRSGMELYTKKGDGGRASTITRMNIPKNSPIFELLGTLDEFTSALGVAKRKAPASLAPLLEEIQGNVIALNGELAGGQKFATGEKVRQLEAAIDSLMENVPPFSGLHPAGRFRGRRGPGSGPRRGPPGGTLRGGRLPDRRREPRRAGLDEPLVGFAVRSGPRLRPHDAPPRPRPRPRPCRI